MHMFCHTIIPATTLTACLPEPFVLNTISRQKNDMKSNSGVFDARRQRRRRLRLAQVPLLLLRPRVASLAGALPEHFYQFDGAFGAQHSGAFSATVYIKDVRITGGDEFEMRQVCSDAHVARRIM